MPMVPLTALENTPGIFQILERTVIKTREVSPLQRSLLDECWQAALAAERVGTRPATSLLARWGTAAGLFQLRLQVRPPAGAVGERCFTSDLEIRGATERLGEKFRAEDGLRAAIGHLELIGREEG